MADEFPNFSLELFEDFEENDIYDLGNLEENQLLAEIDIDSVINSNTVIVPVKEAKKKPTNKERTSETEKQRFVKLSNASIDNIITRAETKNTKEMTKWAVRVFEGKSLLFNYIIKM